MSTNRRDIELLISAKETTGRSFGQVVSNIAALNAKIGEQVAAAERGEGSLKDLRESQEALAQSGRDLASIQGQIDAYGKISANTEKAAASYAEAQAKLAAMTAELAKAEKVTDAQEKKLQRLENAVVKTGAALEKNKADLAAQVTVLQNAGVATDQLSTLQNELVNNARNVGAGLTQAKSGIENFGEAVRLAREGQATADRAAAVAERELADAQRLAAAEGQAAARIAAEQQAQRTRQAAANEANLLAQRGFQQKIEEARQLGDASRFVQLFAESVNQVAVADSRLAALSGFRAVGQQALEASNDVSRFVTTGQAFAVSSSAVAEGLRSMIDPGAQALRTLEGVEKAIREADAAAAAGSKNVSILNTAYNNLSEASAALLRTGGLVDAFQNQEVAVAGARQQFSEAQADVQRYASAMASAATPTQEMVTALAQAEARLETTGHALATEETRLGTLSRELRAAGVDTKNLAASMARLEAAAGTAGATMSRISTATGRNGAKTNGIFGLKPQDLVNVGYQINDIVVSLASGQKPLTVFVQQGAQLAQIPGFLSGIINVLLRWFPAIAILVAVGAAMAEIIGDAQRLKQAQEDLAVNPLGAGIDAQKFANAQEKLESLGASAEDARKATLALLEEGFNTEQIEKYSVAAEQLSKRLGVDLVQATELLVGIQKGGIDTVYDLAEKTNDLTTADLNHAEALFAAGKAAEARQFILDRVAERNEEIAKATESSWTPAVNNLKTAWNNLANFLSDVAKLTLAPLIAYIKEAVREFTFLTGLLAGKGIAGSYAEAYAPKPKTPQRGESDAQVRDRRYLASLEEEYNVSKQMTAEQRRQLAGQKARDKAQAAGVSKAVEELAVTKAIAQEQSKIDKDAAAAARKGEAASNRAKAARDKAARAAEAEQRKRDQAQQQLEKGLRTLNRNAFAGESASLEERLQGVDEKYESIYDSIKKVQSLGLTKAADGTDLATIKFQVEATKDRLKDEERIGFYQQKAELLTKARAAEIQQVTDKVARGTITASEAVNDAARINGEYSGQISDAANEALKVAAVLGGTNPSPEMVSWIASLERLVDGEANNNIVAKVGLDSLGVAGDKLDDILKARDDLVNAYSTLGDLGTESSGEVRAAIKEAYSTAAADAAPFIAQLRAQVELLHNTESAVKGIPLLTDTAYEAWMAKLDVVNAKLAQSETKLSELENSTLQGIATAGVNAFNTLGSSMAGFIAGTKSLGDVFSDVGRSILQSMADITAAIAQAIVKFLILRALEGAAGLPPGSLTGGSKAGGGLFGLFHSGGVVGSKGGKVRRDNAANWTGAPKFHGGGMAGLEQGEYRAILKRKEEVLTEDNPRHVNNIGSGDGNGGGGAPAIKQVLLLDPDAVPSAMKTRAGQQSILTTIRANKATIKQMLS